MRMGGTTVYCEELFLLLMQFFVLYTKLGGIRHARHIK